MKSFLPAILIVICIGAYFSYIKPTYSEIKDLMRKKEDYVSLSQKARQITAKRDDILNTYNSISGTDKARLDKIIPERFDGVFLANHINNIANKYGMVADGFSNSAGASANPDSGMVVSKSLYKTHKMSFSVEGRYENFILFLKDLENNFNIVDINSVNISDSGNGDRKTNSMKYSIEFQTYSIN